jgi:hypothetical protein
LTSNTTTPAVGIVTVIAGYSVDATKPNTSFMTQGASISNSAAAVAGGIATVRVSNFADTSTDDFYNVTVAGGTLSTVTASANIDKDTANNAGFNLANGANLSGGINFYTDGNATASDHVDLQLTHQVRFSLTLMQMVQLVFQRSHLQLVQLF